MQRIIWATAALLLIGVITMVVISWRRPLAVAAWMNRRTLVRAGFTKTRVPTSLGSLTMFTGGEGPTVILLHGAGDQAGTWAKIAPELKSKYRVVIPDLAGHGESDPKAGPLRVGTVLAGIEAIVNSEPGKVIIVGNSLGAWVGALYAQKHPEKVERLVLVNGGPLIGDRPDITLTPKNRQEARRTLDALMDPGAMRIPNYVVDDIVREGQSGPLMRLSQTADEMPKYLLTGRLQEITAPVDLLWGESDQVMSLGYARRMRAELPSARLATLARCGHAPQLECPRAFRQKLMEVLQTPIVPRNFAAAPEAKVQ